MIIKMNYWFQKKRNTYNERLDKIEELTKKINFDNLKYFIEKSGIETDFNATDDLLPFLTILKQIK